MTVIATYPTAAVVLSEQVASGSLAVLVQEVWTGGEDLGAPMRSTIEQGFGCPVRDSYGASEFLPIAWECGQGVLHANADWVILEPVDDHHRRVPPGTLSHTTLLTNLANHALPLVRYDIGDRLVVSPLRCDCGSALPVIEVRGRADDVLLLRGDDGAAVPLLPLAIATLLEEDAGLFDFHLEQQGPAALCLRVRPRDAAAGEHAARLLRGQAKAHGASSVRVRVLESDTLPRGRTGKLQRIVCAGKASRKALTAGRADPASA